jgi:hypothetical protein
MKLNMFISGTLLGSFLILSGCQQPYTSLDPVSEVYRVDVVNSSYGTVTAIPASGILGTEITLLVNPKPGYILRNRGLTYGINVNNIMILAAAPYRFSMPSGNVMITAEFVEVPRSNYTVTIDPVENGHIVSYPQYGSGADEFTLELFPDSGYALKEGSLKVNNRPVEGPPYISKFSFFNTNVVVTAEFEPKDAAGLVNSGKEALAAGDYNGAFNFFEAAYKKDNGNTEAIIYSTLGKIASIPTDTNFRLMMQRFGINRVPGNMNTLYSNDWLIDYEGMMLPEVFTPSGYPSGFQNYGVYYATKSEEDTSKPTLSALPVIMFFNLMKSSNNRQFNTIVDEILKYAFGDTFETAAARAETLQYGTTVPVDRAILEHFGLNERFEGQGYNIGRAELDALIGSMRMIKSAVEWLASYNWDIDSSFFLTWWEDVHGLNECMDNIFNGAQGIPGLFKRIENEQNFSFLPYMLPLKSQFFKARSSDMIDKAKSDFRIAIDTLDHAADYFFTDGDAQFPQVLRDKLNDILWISDGIDKIRSAITSGGDFYFPTIWPVAGTTSWNYTNENAKYGINMARVFNHGQFSIDRLLVTKTGGKSPEFFGFGSDNLNEGTVITSPEQFPLYNNIGIQINMVPLKEVFVKGFETYGDKGWFHDLYSDALLTQENGEKLYRLYHMER